MSAQLHPETEWSPQDEEWMQEVRQDPLRAQWQRNAIQDYRKVANSRNGEIVRLLVPHPFQDEKWRIFGPAPEPGFYYLHCVSEYRCTKVSYRSAFEEVRHESEFTSQSV